MSWPGKIPGLGKIPHEHRKSDLKNAHTGVGKTLAADRVGAGASSRLCRCLRIRHDTGDVDDAGTQHIGHHRGGGMSECAGVIRQGGSGGVLWVMSSAI